MRVVPRKGLERVLPVQKDDGVLARPEEMLGRGGAARARGKVVEEADAVRGDDRSLGSAPNTWVK